VKRHYFTAARLKCAQVFPEEGQIVRNCDGPNFFQQFVLTGEGRADLRLNKETGHGDNHNDRNRRPRASAAAR
jgi:hypothetical protein